LDPEKVSEEEGITKLLRLLESDDAIEKIKEQNEILVLFGKVIPPTAAASKTPQGNTETENASTAAATASATVTTQGREEKIIDDEKKNEDKDSKEEKSIEELIKEYEDDGED
jgi:hypothetical protein